LTNAQNEKVKLDADPENLFRINGNRVSLCVMVLFWMEDCLSLEHPNTMPTSNALACPP